MVDFAMPILVTPTQILGGQLAGIHGKPRKTQQILNIIKFGHYFPKCDYGIEFATPLPPVLVCTKNAITWIPWMFSGEDGKIVPAGTNFGIATLHMGRQEDLFPEANTFKPGRFEIGYSTEKVNPYAYIPFSAGPRNCIGQKFAMLEIKTVLCNVLRHYEVKCAGNKEDELLLIAELILRTKDPLMFKIKPRVH